MKILYAINSAKRGGAEVHLLDLISGMISLQHEVYVWCPSGEMSEEYKRLGAKVTEISINFDIDPIYIYKLYKFLRDQKVDVVHTHELKASGNGILAAYLASVKVRISHTHTPISEWKIPKWKKFINLKLFYSPFVNKFSTYEIALTESRAHVKEIEGIKKEKLHIIPNGINLEKFTIDVAKKEDFRYEMLCRYDLPEDVYVFGNIGRLSIEKGLDVLVSAFSEFLKLPHVVNKNIFLMLIGAGTEFDNLKKLVFDLGIKDNVILPGEIFLEEDKVKYLSLFDCFVFPSRAEGFGLVLLEAMAMSLPTICSDLPVLQEVGGSAVLFFEDGNKINLCEKMYNIYSKREILESVVEDERRRVEDLYTYDIFVKNYENLYLEILGGSL